jgi:Ca-activated chloride channel family protein
VPLPEWAYPAWLLFLPLVPVLLIWWRRRGGRRLPHPAVRFLMLPVGRSRWVERLSLWGRGLGLALLLVALAGPRWPEGGERERTEGIALLLVLDVSGSMAEADYPWPAPPGPAARISRLEAAQRAFRLLVAGGTGPQGEHLPGRPNDLIGLVTFAARPQTACPLTLSHEVLLHLLEEQQAETLPEEARTNIGDALAWGLHRLRRAGALRQVLVLLTDGEHNVPPPALTPRQAAQLAGNLGVPIHVIDAGPDPEALPPTETTSIENRRRAQRQLREVARLTGGQYFSAPDGQGLLTVCAQIDALERRPITSFRYRHYQELACWPGLAALGVLALVVLLEQTWGRRIP